MFNVDVSGLKASFYLSKFCLLRLRHVLCLRVRDADVAFILCWAGRVGSHPRVTSGRAGGLVLLCSLTLILGWLGCSCSCLGMGNSPVGPVASHEGLLV